jgi:hypothetical protein
MVERGTSEVAGLELLPLKLYDIWRVETCNIIGGVFLRLSVVTVLFLVVK